MSSIRWLLAALRKFILGNTFVRASTRGLLWLLASLWRATKGPSPRSTFADDSRVVFAQTPDHDGGHTLTPTSPVDTENPVGYISASSMPAFLQPYLNSGPGGSQASEDTTTYSMPQESYPLHNLSDHHPGSSSIPHLPPSTSMQDLQLGPGGSPPSKNSSVVDLPLPDSPRQPRHSSGVDGDAAVNSLPCLSKTHKCIFPGTPETLRRYDRKAIIPPDPSTFCLPPLAMDGLPNPPTPGWTACQHPKGALYFFQEEQRVFTDANLFDMETLLFINENLRIVNDFLSTHSVHLDPGVDLVLDENIDSDGTRECQYYFVNHVGRCVFWMDNGDSDLFPVTAHVKGMTSASHIRHELEAQYWLHCEYYPRAFELTHEIINELRDIVLHAASDVFTSSTTTVSWKIDDLRDMNTCIAGCNEIIGKHTENKFEGSNCLVGRLMHKFARDRVYNFHGEPGARLNIHKSVHGTMQKGTMFIRLLNLLLLSVPNSHLSGLRALSIDGIIRHSRWAQFVKGLISEWQDCNINAAVILAANVGFLSIQSVDQGSPAQMASYVSTVASIASILIGLLLLGYHRNLDSNSAAAISFTSNDTDWRRPLEALAVLYSLPFSMLLWS
ncbi:hypothetical protein MSAN_01139800 [Mycena sanguinolenta]|uniref:Uncharacterized protein n=1 Tax=Mycena sanguinolenta TaxID=230812 RepID=A0A8H6YLZ8_9AGAR|nr:hypothetical protein MSAN_01139800 [Mycena sanguinolenta]